MMAPTDWRANIQNAMLGQRPQMNMNPGQGLPPMPMGGNRPQMMQQMQNIRQRPIQGQRPAWGQQYGRSGFGDFQRPMPPQPNKYPNQTMPVMPDGSVT